MVEMDDEGRLARVGSFSAVCSPPLSMMFKGRMSKSSKSKKIELTDELDDEICDALCKISKSSEELWKEVSTIFSPPTPIGSKVSDYTPFDSYKNPNTPNAPNTPNTPTTARLPNEAEGDHSASNHTALAILAATSGDRAVRQNNANPSAVSAQFLTPYPPNVINKIIHNAGATVPNSIAIPHIVVSNSKADGEEGRKEAKMLNDPGFAQPNDAAVRSTTITPLKRPKRTRNDHLSPNSSVKSLSSKAGPDGKLNAANINSIINNSGLSDSDGSAASGDSHEDSLDTHNAHRSHQNQLQNSLSQSAPNPTHHNHTTSPQLQQTALTNIAGLFSNYSHNHSNFNFGNHNSAQSSHSHEPSLNFNQTGFNSLGNATGNNITNFTANNASHASNMYNSNTNNSNANNAHNFSTWNDSNGAAVSNNNNNNGHACSNCNSCNNHSHNHNHNHNTNATSNLIGMGLNGNFSTNDKYWTEVIFCCKKLVALAGSGLAGPLSFSELVDALTLARHIMSTTAAVMNSGAYTPFPTDEFNRLVGETFGNFGHNITNNNTTTPSSNLHTNLINLNANANNHTYPYFTQGNNSTPSTSLPLPHSALTPPSPSPAFSSSSHPDTPPSPSLAISSPLSTLGSSSSSSAWGSSSSYAFDESRRKLPIPLPVTKEEESSDDESPTPSPPPMSPLSTLSVVPLSPGISPSSTPSEKGTKEKEGKEVKEKEGKEGSWKKPRGKKRPKYEADLMCLSCGVRQTPEWRRGPAGAKTLCNACGLHWAKVLKAEGKGDQKKAALLEAKRSQFMLAAQKRTQGK